MSNDYLSNTRAAYGGSAKRYCEVVGVVLGNEFETTEDREILRGFAYSLEPSELQVIDAGCGSGRIAHFLDGRGLGNVLGVDIAAGMID